MILFIHHVATLIITHSLTTELTVTDFKNSAQLTVTDSRTTELTVTHSATAQLIVTDSLTTPLVMTDLIAA